MITWFLLLLLTVTSEVTDSRQWRTIPDLTIWPYYYLLFTHSRPLMMIAMATMTNEENVIKKNICRSDRLQGSEGQFSIRGTEIGSFRPKFLFHDRWSCVCHNPHPRCHLRRPHLQKKGGSWYKIFQWLTNKLLYMTHFEYECRIFPHPVREILTMFRINKYVLNIFIDRDRYTSNFWTNSLPGCPTTTSYKSVGEPD